MNSELTIFHPSDPLGKIVGGAEYFVNGVVQYAPDDLDIRFIGISSDPQNSPPGKWRKMTLGSKTFDFLPLLSVKSENHKPLFPLSLRYTVALKRVSKTLSCKTMLFNRIEPVIALRKAKSVKIAVVHNDIQQQISKKGGEVLWSKFPFLYFTYEKIVFKSLNYVFTVSENTLNFYRAKYQNSPLCLDFIPTFVDTSVFHPSQEQKSSIRARLPFPPGKCPPIASKWILFVGRLQPQKDPLLLIRSFHEYYRKNSAASLVIVGDGNERAKMEKLIESLSIKDHVFFTGAIKRQIISEFYQASDTLLLTSRYEGMPMCVLEALASGLPVVSTHTGEVKKIIKNGQAGKIADSFEPQGIAQSLEEVLSNPDSYQNAKCTDCVKDYKPEIVLDPIYKIARQMT